MSDLVRYVTFTIEDYLKDWVPSEKEIQEYRKIWEELEKDIITDLASRQGLPISSEDAE
jgi:hypothetical protein